MKNKTQEHPDGEIIAYASGSGSLSFVIRDKNRNPVSGRSPTGEECIAYIKDKLQKGQGAWAENRDWIIVNQGQIDRENHEKFEAVQKVERLASNKLLYHGKEYTYDPEKAAGTSTPLFTTTVGTAQIEVEGTGNNGALGYFLKNERVLTNPSRIIWESNQQQQSTESVLDPNEGIKIKQERYAVDLILESGKRIQYFDFADDANHAEGLAIASQTEQVLETVGVRLASLYQEFKAAGIEIRNHESDMYVPITRESTEILENYPLQKATATKFKSNIDGKLTYDIPFSFDPFWEKKMKRQSIVDARNIASEKDSFDEINTGVNKTYEGKVMGVTEGHVVLSVGRNALIVAKSDLDRIPTKDESVILSFKEGKGIVFPSKEKTLSLSR